MSLILINFLDLGSKNASLKQVNKQNVIVSVWTNTLTDIATKNNLEQKFKKYRVII